MFRTFAVSTVLGFLVLLSLDSTARTPAAGKNLYIVVLRNPPAVKAHRAEQLIAQHDALLRTIGSARKLYSYSHALNGFAAELSQEQATKLRADPSVISVA